jgi:protein involved in polysaccharide export with SLBB domain
MHRAVRSVTLRGLLLALLMPAMAAAQVQPQDTSAASGGPIRLRQPQGQAAADDAATRPGSASFERSVSAPPTAPQMSAAAPSDFEVYVRRLNQDQPVRRFGSELLRRLHDASDTARGTTPVLPDYTLRPGDEIIVNLWGSIDADLRLQLDRNGQVQIPRVGPVMLAGVRQADAAEVISRRVAQVFRNFNVNVTLGQLKAIRVYVTGFVEQPGALSVGAVSTLTQALMQAGGPSAAGSFRQIQLRRGGALIGQYDLYDLLVNGNRVGDRFLQAEDVIHVGPVGTQVALIGSVNRAAIFELKAGEKVADVLRMAGGFSPVSDTTRLSLTRFGDRNQGRIVELPLPTGLEQTPINGDVLGALNVADLALPSERQNKRVRIEGEVARPGDYVLPPTSTLADALAAAGGLTGQAYVYGTTFTRESVRKTQQENFERALRDLETQMTTHNATRRTASAEEAAAAEASTQATSRFIEQLRKLKPTGRVVLQLEPRTQALPELALEDGDRLQVPSRPTSVGVFGSVFNAGSFLYGESRTLESYLQQAGGPTRGADRTSLFVVRANGSVISAQQKPSSWFSSEEPILKTGVEPGDTVFVPEEMDKTTFVQKAKDWTQILYQFGLGIAGIVAVTR